MITGKISLIKNKGKEIAFPVTSAEAVYMPDGKTTVNEQLDTNTNKLQTLSYCTVEEFKEDNDMDYTNAFKKALIYSKENGVCIQLKPKEYTISEPIDLTNINKIFLKGFNSTYYPSAKIIFTGNGSLFTLNTLTYCSVNIDGIMFNGNGSNSCFKNIKFDHSIIKNSAFFDFDNCLINCDCFAITKFVNNTFARMKSSVFFNTSFMDCYITDNYFTGGYFSDGSNVYMPKVFDGSYTIGMTGIKNNWFEFFNFIGNFKANTTINNNLFDYCLSIAYFIENVSFTDNTITHSTYSEIINNVNFKNYNLPMYDVKEKYFLITFEYGGVNILNNSINSLLNNANKTCFIKIKGAYGRESLYYNINISNNSYIENSEINYIVDVSNIPKNTINNDAKAYKNVNIDITNVNLLETPIIDSNTIIYGMKIRVNDIIYECKKESAKNCTVFWLSRDGIINGFNNVNLLPTFDSGKWYGYNNIQSMKNGLMAKVSVSTPQWVNLKYKFNVEPNSYIKLRNNNPYSVALLEYYLYDNSGTLIKTLYSDGIYKVEENIHYIEVWIRKECTTAIEFNINTPVATIYSENDKVGETLCYSSPKMIYLDDEYNVKVCYTNI